MLVRKEGRVRVMSKDSRRGPTSITSIADSSKQKKPSNFYQKVIGYLEPKEESVWSKNLDSAASMFPSLDVWQESFQDLSDWCHGPLQDMHSIMEVVTKDSSCTVQDDELNTPDIGLLSGFNFTPNVSSEPDTSLVEEEVWEIPQPVEFSPISSEDEKQVHSVISDTTDSSFSEKPFFETIKTVETGDKTAHYYIVDESWELGREEQVISSSNQVKSSVIKDTEVLVTNNTPIALNMRNIDLLDSSETMISSDTSIEFKHQGLESLLGTNYNVVTLPEGLSLKDLLADSVYEVDTTVTSTNNNVQTHAVSGSISKFKSQGRSLIENRLISALKTHEPVEIPGQKFQSTFLDSSEQETNAPVQTEVVDSAESIIVAQDNVKVKLRTDVVGTSTQNSSPVRLNEEPVLKKPLKLSLSTLLGDDEISTPVVLDSLFKEDGFNLLGYIADNTQKMLESPDVEFEAVLPVTTMDVDIITPSLEVTEDVADTNTCAISLIKDEVENEDQTTIDITSVKSLVNPNIINFLVKDLNITHSNEESDYESKDDDYDDLAVSADYLLENIDKVEDEIKKPLKIKITRNKIPAGDLYSLQSVSKATQNSKRKSSVAENDNLIIKRGRGRPPKQPLPSTSTGKKTKRKSSDSVSDDLWSPTIKRSRLSSCESDGDKYRELRDRNNEASRKSRQNRKSKEQDMNIKAAQLEKENQSLRIKADEMERLVKKLREALLEAVVKKK